MTNERNVHMDVRSLWKAKRWYLLILLLCWGVILLISQPFAKNKGLQQAVKCFDNQYMEVQGSVDENTVIEQKFTGKHNNLKKIEFTTATNGRINEGVMTVSLIDSASGKVVAVQKMNVSEMPDCNMVPFEFPEIPDSKGKEYKITFQADSKADSCIVLMGSKTELLDSARVNGTETQGALRMTVTYHDTKHFGVLVMVWVLLFLLSFVLVILVNGANERSFLILAISFGLLFTVFTPFPYVLDESAHFFRSFLISDGNFIDDFNEAGEIGGAVPVNFSETIFERMNMDQLMNDNELWLSRYSEEKEFFVNPYMSSYNPVNHLPGAVGLKIARILHLPIVYCILFGRLCTLATFITFAYIAIRKASYYKSLFFVTAMLPMTLYLAGSFSADPLLISTSMMFTSICLRYRFEPEQMVKRHELALMLLAVAILGASKYLIYVPVLLLFFMIPQKCFSNRKTYLYEILAAGVVLVIFAVSAIWLVKHFTYIEDRNGHVDVGEQVHFLLSHKLQGLGYLASGFFDTLFSNLSAIGFQHIEVQVIRTFDYVMSLILALAAIFEGRKFRFTDQKERNVFGASLLVLVCLIYAMTVGALYLGYTPVGSASVDGVQARYLLPVLPLLLIGVSSLCPGRLSRKKFEEVLTFFSVLSCLNGICAILLIAFA